MTDALLDAAEALTRAVRDDSIDTRTHPSLEAVEAEVARGRATQELARLDAEDERIAQRQAAIAERRNRLAPLAGKATTRRARGANKKGHTA